MARPKKVGIKKKRGRKRKLPDGKKWADVYATMSIHKDTKNRIKELKDDDDDNINQTFSTCVEIVKTLGDNIIGFDKKYSAQDVLDEMNNFLRKKSKEYR